MLRRRGQALLRSAKPSFAGTGLLERMRSTTFALFGVTAAMALGLVALALQQDWSVLPAAPIPAVPESDQVGEARVAAEQSVGPPALQGTSAEARGGAVTGRGGHASASAGAKLSGPRQVAAAAPSPSSAPGVGTPPVQGAPPASPDPGPPPTTVPPPAPTSEPAPASTPPAPPAAPVSSPDSGAVAAGGSNDEGRAASVSDVDDAKGDGPPDRGKSPGKYRPPRGGGKGSKPPEGDADSVAATPAAPPAVEPEESVDEDVHDAPGGDYKPDEGYSPGHRGKGRGHGRWG